MTRLSLILHSQYQDCWWPGDARWVVAVPWRHGIVTTWVKQSSAKPIMGSVYYYNGFLPAGLYIISCQARVWLRLYNVCWDIIGFHHNTQCFVGSRWSFWKNVFWLVKMYSKLLTAKGLKGKKIMPYFEICTVYVQGLTCPFFLLVQHTKSEISHNKFYRNLEEI